MKRAAIHKSGLIVLASILMFGTFMFVRQYQNANKINKAFAVGYKLFDVIYWRKYFDTERNCWVDNNDILDKFYNDGEHYTTGQYRYLKSGGTEKHAHFKELWARCE